MKKLVLGCLIWGSFMIGDSQVQADIVTKTDVSVTFTRPISSDKLPGQDIVAKPDSLTNKKLPQTGDQVNFYYSVLGGTLLGSGLYLYRFSKKKEVDD